MIRFSLSAQKTYLNQISLLFSLSETLISRHGDRQIDRDSDDGEFCQIELQDQQQDGRFTEPNSSVPSPGQKTNCFVFMASVMASLGGILFGYDIGLFYPDNR